MSLINEALKKAQKQRTGEAPSLSTLPTIGGESAARIARRAPPAGLKSIVLWSCLGAVGLAGVIFSAIVLLRPAAPSIASAKEGSTSAVPSAVGSAKAEALAKEGVSGTAPRATSAIPSAIASAKAEALAKEGRSPASAPTQFVLTIPSAPAASAPSAPEKPAPTATPAPATPAPPTGPLKMELRAITHIETMRVTGIRASATDSKVLMNDRVYRPGDIVEHALGIKLIGITASSLTFEDERGAKYTRNF